MAKFLNKNIAMLICRLCFGTLNKTKSVDLFGDATETELVKIIVKHMHLQIQEDDDVSKRICNDCCDHLKDFHDFYNRIEKCQQDLYEQHRTALEIPVDSENAFFDLKDEAEIESLNLLASNNELDTTFVEALNLEPDIGHSDADDNLCDDAVDFGDEHEGEEHDDDIPSQQEVEIKSEKVEKPNKRVLRSKIKKAKKLSRQSKKTKPETEAKNDDAPESESKVQLRQGKQLWQKAEELIQGHMQLKCELCDCSASTFTDLKHHFSKMHKMKGYIRCCGTRFNRPSNLAEHIRWHLEPDFLKCEICNKKMKSQKNLETHWRNVHSTREERNFECKDCGKRFAHAFNLRMHMSVHQTDNPEACKMCDKSFKTPYSLAQHMKKSHDNSDVNICDICGKEYRFKPSFDRHMAEHQGIVQKRTDQCTICGKWFMPNVIRSHMRKHNAQSVECPICRKSCRTDAARRAHMSYVHNTNPAFKCNLCDKTFKKKITLREHMGIHTGTKEFSCAHCHRQFRSRSNMYVHVKRDHFEEWKLVQDKRFAFRE